MVFIIKVKIMADSPQLLSDAQEANALSAHTITEDLSLMRVLQYRAAKGEPSRFETAFSRLGRRTHRMIRETVFGFRVPAGQ